MAAISAPTAAPLPTPSRFYSLDVLRGFAALSVVLWHWQHFFLPMNREGSILDAKAQPLYDVFYLFYRKGFVAVQLFFCLSGFIFFWLYATRIAARAISAREFAMLRLSRLYPLHVVTLVFVLIGQIIHTRITNTPYVYEANDTYHFVLNLFFVSSWGFSRDVYSFNGPTWSVSVEMLLYALFFLYAWLGRVHLVITFALALVGHYVVGRFDKDVASGIEMFFLGGTVYLLFDWILRSGDWARVTRWLPVFTAVGWIATFVSMGTEGRALAAIGVPVSERLGGHFAIYILFPATIMSLALLETRFGSLGKRIAFIGDVSYASYLLHFPLQLVVATAITALAIDPAIYYAPWLLVTFFACLIVLSLASHRYFEMPMQRWLRKKLSPRRVAAVR